MSPLRLLCLLLALFLVQASAQQQQAPPPELERIEKTLQTLNELKAKVAAVEQELDALIAELSVQKGAVANAKSAPFGGVAGVSGGASDSPDRAKPKPGRCAAITAKGERCSRAAVAGSRYCRQHQTAHQ